MEIIDLSVGATISKQRSSVASGQSWVYNLRDGFALPSLRLAGLKTSFLPFKQHSIRSFGQCRKGVQAIVFGALAGTLAVACTRAFGGDSVESSGKSNLSGNLEHRPAGKLLPSGMFLQTGDTGSVTSVTAGLLWNTDWKPLGNSTDVYLEGSLSHWRTRTGESRGASWTQGALIPVLRYRFDEANSPWFSEAGIGLTLMNRSYQANSCRFGSAFNFGDHVAVGYSFGPHRANELALRFEHFSNGGIRQPNPGMNFGQLRYSRWF